MNRKHTLMAIGMTGVISGVACASQDMDFGLQVDHQAFAQSNKLFGVIKPLEELSVLSVSAVTADTDPTSVWSRSRRDLVPG